MSSRRMARDEITRTLALPLRLARQLLEGGVVPGVEAALAIQNDVISSWLQVLSGKKELSHHLKELGDRTVSGLRYGRLVTSLGRELFGSATFPGEQQLAQNELMTLSYLPAQRSEGGDPHHPALFHVGGFIPFGDRVFRILPEANLFMHFLRRGVPVYAMALRRDPADVGSATMARLVDIIDALSDVAFQHAGRRRMIIEGYCGLAMPMLTYLAAKPREADAKFSVACTIVAPVDSRRCGSLYESISATPRYLLLASLISTELLGGVLPGRSLQTGIDLPLGTLFLKSPPGRFLAGWRQERYATIRSVDQLDPRQRRELAGAYWISPENCQQLPMPVDIARFTTDLWTGGIDESLQIPCSYGGRPLTLRTIIDETRIQLAGFYGGRDPVVPESTAHVLRDVMGERYSHVVHPKAGHISYVLSPEIWDPGHRHALDPNPVDRLLELHHPRG